MRWGWITREVGDKRYLAGCKLIAEKGRGDGGLFRDKPLGLPEYVTKDGQYLYEVIDNPDYDPAQPAGEENPTLIYVDEPQELSEERKVEIAEVHRKRTLSKSLTLADLYEAVVALKDGDPSKVEELESPINLEVENKEIPDGPKGDAV